MDIKNNIISKKPLFFIGLILFWVLIIPHSFAACAADAAEKPQVIGQVVWVKGTVEAVVANGTPRSLKRRDSIYTTDTLKSAIAGTGQIVFTDGGLLAIREASTIKIAEYKFNQQGPAASDKYVVDVVEGGFRTITGAISKANPAGYQIKTPVATIGVRGTDFSVFYSKQGCDKGVVGKQCGLVVKVDFGTVALANQGGEVALTAGSNPYARVESAKQVPAVIEKMPTAFTNNVSLAPATFDSNIPPSPLPAAGGSSSKGSTNGNGGFCIQ